jgi:hypothetical protein
MQLRSSNDQSTSLFRNREVVVESTIVVVVEGENCCLNADNQKKLKLAMKKFV